ncbi:sugar transferase [Holospora curviuscula]|uniref:Putative sugar transferase EpsL n=1 Tax=Holospora curviuscula TaxID=1082868 RepID=A0A2S5R850_9PROT|nr:sugar transferase [Holospora curviuscula]PPE03511.1 putative sugar transferase EpsL [Holospora curviuscula]
MKIKRLQGKLQKTFLFWFFLLISFPVWIFVFIEVLLWYCIGNLMKFLFPKRYQKIIFQYSKRILDVSVSITVLLIAFPFLLCIMTCNWVILGSPIFFIQPRIGRAQKKFLIIKFRSMCQKNLSGALMSPEEVQISPYGSFIRAYSFDELPSLWNVLKGDISLVGPRPLVPEFINDHTPKQRHCVRPGLTGLAQINGRNFLHWDEKFAYDIYYVHHQNYVLDLKILLRTLCVLCSGEHSQLASLEKFFP